MRYIHAFWPACWVALLGGCGDPLAEGRLGAADPSLASHALRIIDLGSLDGTGSSFAWDINDAGTVVGHSSAGLETHAFRWTEAHGMEDLGTLGGGFSTAAAINRQGTIAGLSTDAAGTIHLVAWRSGGQIVDLGTTPAGTYELVPTGINDANQIVGFVIPENVPFSEPFLWTPRTGIVRVPLPPWSEVYPHALNNRGDMAGMSCCGLAENYGAFLLGRGAPTLQDLGGVTNGSAAALDISDNRVLVGWDQPSSTLDPQPYQTVPWRWSRGRGFEILGSLGGDYGVAQAINRRGEIVGGSGLDVGGCCAQHAFFWSRRRGMVDLGTLDGGHSLANAINNRREIVGYATIGAVIHATLWSGHSSGRRPGGRVPGATGRDAQGPAPSCAFDRGGGPSKGSRLLCMLRRR